MSRDSVISLARKQIAAGSIEAIRKGRSVRPRRTGSFMRWLGRAPVLVDYGVSLDLETLVRIDAFDGEVAITPAWSPRVDG